SGRIRKDDVMAAAERPSGGQAQAEARGAGARSVSSGAAGGAPAPGGAPVAGSRGVRRERMTRIRQRIAERLVEAKQTTAMLTTFNECDMSEVMRLRSEHKDAFEKAHGIGLGFMGFFLAASVSALRKYPRANAYIVENEDGSAEIEYHDYCDI